MLWSTKWHLPGTALFSWHSEKSSKKFMEKFDIGLTAWIWALFFSTQLLLSCTSSIQLFFKVYFLGDALKDKYGRRAGLCSSSISLEFSKHRMFFLSRKNTFCVCWAGALYLSIHQRLVSSAVFIWAAWHGSHTIKKPPSTLTYSMENFRHFLNARENK